MPPAVAESSEDLPDEIPLSDLSDSLSEIPLGSEADGVAPAQDADGVLDEIPLSPMDEVEPTTAHGSLDDCCPPEGNANPLAGEVAVPDSALEATRPVERSISSRRGRKDHCMLQALEEAHKALARDDMCAVAAASSVDASPSALVLLRASDSKTTIKSAIAATNLQRHCRADLLPSVLAGFATASPLETALVAAGNVAKAPGQDHDEEVRRIGAHMLWQEVMPFASKRFLSDTLSVDERKLDRTMPRLASALLLSDRAHRRNFERLVVDSLCRAQLVLYCDFAAYDETPLPTQMRNDQMTLQMGSSAPSQSTDALANISDTLAAFTRCPEIRMATRSSSQKVVQTLQVGGMVVKVDGVFFLLKVATLNSLVVVERTTAETLKQVQLQLSGVSRAAQCFQQQVRASCTDGYAANSVCERSIAVDRGGDDFFIAHLV